MSGADATSWQSASIRWRSGHGPEGSYVEIAVEPDYVDDDAWGADFDRHLDALAGLAVARVAPGRPVSRGVYRFRTPPVVPVAALVRPNGIGDRAAMDLFLTFAPLIDALSTAARGRELALHRNLGPLQLNIDADGQGHWIGAGIPPIEMWDWLDDPTLLPSGPTLAVTPPERVAGEPEDVSTDLYALALICSELALGRPLLGATGGELIDAIRRGDAYGAVKGRLRRAFASVLAPWPDQRPSAQVAVEAVRSAAEGASGASLRDLAAAKVAAVWGLATTPVPQPSERAPPPAGDLAHEALARAEGWARKAATEGGGTAEARAAVRAVERVRYAIVALQTATDPARQADAQRALDRAVDAARIAAEAAQRRSTAVPIERSVVPRPARHASPPAPPPEPLAPEPPAGPAAEPGPSQPTGLRRGLDRRGTVLADWERLRRPR